MASFSKTPFKSITSSDKKWPYKQMNKRTKSFFIQISTEKRKSTSVQIWTLSAKYYLPLVRDVLFVTNVTYSDSEFYFLYLKPKVASNENKIWREFSNESGTILFFLFSHWRKIQRDIPFPPPPPPTPAKDGGVLQKGFGFFFKDQIWTHRTLFSLMCRKKLTLQISFFKGHRQ